MDETPARTALYVQSDQDINLGHSRMLYKGHCRCSQRLLDRGVDRRDLVAVGFEGHRRRRRRIFRRRNVGGLRRRCRLQIEWSWVGDGL